MTDQPASPDQPDRDLGLATQRTTLAWQRTALATATGAAVMARLSFDRLGVEAVVTLAASLLLSAWILAESHLRFRSRPNREPQRRSHGGKAALVLTIAVVLMAITELAVLTDQISGFQSS